MSLECILKQFNNDLMMNISRFFFIALRDWQRKWKMLYFILKLSEKYIRFIHSVFLDFERRGHELISCYLRKIVDNQEPDLWHMEETFTIWIWFFLKVIGTGSLKHTFVIPFTLILNQYVLLYQAAVLERFIS